MLLPVRPATVLPASGSGASGLPASCSHLDVLSVGKTNTWCVLFTHLLPFTRSVSCLTHIAQKSSLVVCCILASPPGAAMTSICRSTPQWYCAPQILCHTLFSHGAETSSCASDNNDCYPRARCCSPRSLFVFCSTGRIHIRCTAHLRMDQFALLATLYTVLHRYLHTPHIHAYTPLPHTFCLPHTFIRALPSPHLQVPRHSITTHTLHTPFTTPPHACHLPHARTHLPLPLPRIPHRYTATHILTHALPPLRTRAMPLPYARATRCLPHARAATHLYTCWRCSPRTAAFLPLPRLTFHRVPHANRYCATWAFPVVVLPSSCSSVPHCRDLKAISTHTALSVTTCQPFHCFVLYLPAIPVPSHLSLFRHAEDHWNQFTHTPPQSLDGSNLSAPRTRVCSVWPSYWRLFPHLTGGTEKPDTQHRWRYHIIIPAGGVLTLRRGPRWHFRAPTSSPTLLPFVVVCCYVCVLRHFVSFAFYTHWWSLSERC